jgi:hypothetical protein
MPASALPTCPPSERVRARGFSPQTSASASKSGFGSRDLGAASVGAPLALAAATTTGEDEGDGLDEDEGSEHLLTFVRRLVKHPSFGGSGYRLGERAFSFHLVSWKYLFSSTS